MQLGTLVDKIADDLNKGASITDSQIKDKIYEAIHTLELAHNWAYMDRFVEFTIDLDAENPRVLPVPVGFKNMEFLRLTIPGQEEYQYLTECDPRDIRGIPEADIDCPPQRYFKDGLEYFWMDATPAEAYTGEMSYRKFTTFSTDDTFEPVVLQRYWGLIKYQTLTNFGPFIRDPNQMSLYEKLLAQNLKVALDDNEELEYSNRPERMQYS